jgi:NitT/TauT family transport system ATP-binding protein
MLGTESAVGDDSSPGKSPVKIRINRVTKDFKGKKNESVRALDDFSLDIRQGEFFVIVGPSGCGKSTLLRMLGGLETPTVGSVEMLLPDSGVEHGARPGNAMVFQGDSIFPWMTVWDNASFGLRMRGASKAEINATVSDWLTKTGLIQFAQSYPHQLSGGMRQRVSLARAFATGSDVLLMDEPFSALDEQNKTLLQQELLRIWEESRKTVVFITHSVEEAVTLGDRVLVMTARPGRAKTLLPVPFERPRDVFDLRRRPEYGALVHEIWSSLRDEVAPRPTAAGS